MVHRAMNNMREQHDLSCTFSAATRRREALQGTDSAACMIMAGGMGALEADINISLKYKNQMAVMASHVKGRLAHYGLAHLPPITNICWRRVSFS